MKAIWLGLAAALALATAAAAAERPEGRWVSQTGNVEVQIARCGPALCGVVVKVMANRSMEAAGAMSAAPPPKVGQLLMRDFKPSSDGQWTGKLFNRENGRTYDCVITPHGQTLSVRPYVLLPLFGKDLVWSRAAS
jgi:uncharacterized protein (DUF2147 family)